MITELKDAQSALITLYAVSNTALDSDARAKFLSIVSSPILVETIANSPEFVYANQDDFDDEAKALAADVIDYATRNLWFGLAEDQRGAKISAILRGETVEDAPAPKAEFVVNGDEAPTAPGVI